MMLLKNVLFGSLMILQHWTSANDYAVCVNHLNQTGTCRDMKTCEPLVRLLRAYGTTARGFLIRSQCSGAGDGKKVCCPNTKLDEITPEKPKPVAGGYGFLYSPDCGIRKNTGRRIVLGTEAELGAWPWIALLLYRPINNSSKPRYLCGGALITTRHVLTAGHCVYSQDDLYLVRLGELDVEDDNDGATPVDISIEKRIIHPDYNPDTFSNDIAILRLNRDVEFTKFISPICLPIPEDVQETDLSEEYPFTVGWGAIFYHGPTSSKLLQIESRVVSQDECKAAYDNTTAIIDDRVLCSNFGRNHSSVCQGDSGGPMMLPVGQSWYNIGIVSHGAGCANESYPSIYTKTQVFLDFIEKNLI